MSWPPQKTGKKNPSWKGRKAKYRAIHAWVNKQYPRSGVCEECGKEGWTEYAFLRHPAVPTRDRDDYQELCRSCHMKMDFSSGIRDNHIHVGY